MDPDEPSIVDLKELVQKASRDNPHLTSRLEKAAFLLVLRDMSPLGLGHYRIGSEDGLRCYEVRNGHSNCSDYVGHGPGHPCKHRLAVALHLTLRNVRAARSPNGLVLTIEAG